ncbi:hypothetical protein Nepgr_013514 [Nepenthes gracilis]|uniref:Secreted protein n=1 Tax=Nepenthes gracilis TaxID=150966 RepID=A0AAD3SI12_NEPGR|nr:hypothetical protein Nepgr_013514 [Nepenthes gracilis]
MMVVLNLAGLRRALSVGSAVGDAVDEIAAVGRMFGTRSCLSCMMSLGVPCGSGLVEDPGGVGRCSRFDAVSLDWIVPLLS